MQEKKKKQTKFKVFKVFKVFNTWILYNLRVFWPDPVEICCTCQLMAAALFPGTPQEDGSRVPGYLWISQVIIRGSWSGNGHSTGLVKTASPWQDFQLGYT